MREPAGDRDQNRAPLERLVGAGSPRWVGMGLALVAVVALVAALAWRGQPTTPVVGASESPSGMASGAPSGLPFSAAPTATPASTSTTALTAAPTATPSAPSAATTLTPGITPQPTPATAAKPSKDFGCSWAGGLMVSLADGRVLVGGATCVEIFDPTTRTFRATGRPAAVRLVAPATLLRDGRVFVAGAPASNLDQPWTNSAAIVTNDELYDPATGRFTPISPVRTRMRSAAIQLPDGRVLIVAPQAVGPEGLTGEPAFAELFDPKTGTFSAAGPLAYRVTAPTLILQSNGKVLVAEPGGGNVLTQLYDPATNTFRATRGQLEGGLACAGLPTGGILFVHAYPGPAYGYDPRTEIFHSLARMATSTPIQYYTCTPLTDGRVLVVGESAEAANENQTVSTMLAGQIYDPVRDTWTDLGELNLRRRQGDVRVTFGVAALPNGSAIVIADEPGGGTGSTPEVFDPKTNKFVVNE